MHLSAFPWDLYTAVSFLLVAKLPPAFLSQGWQASYLDWHNTFIFISRLSFMINNTLQAFEPPLDMSQETENCEESCLSKAPSDHLLPAEENVGSCHPPSLQEGNDYCNNNLVCTGDPGKESCKARVTSDEVCSTLHCFWLNDTWDFILGLFWLLSFLLKSLTCMMQATNPDCCTESACGSCLSVCKTSNVCGIWSRSDFHLTFDAN